MKNHIPAVALQVASLAIAPHAPQFTDPRRLLAALDAFDALNTVDTLETDQTLDTCSGCSKSG